MSTATAPYTFNNQQLERIASSIGAAKEYEGDGRIIHESYTKPAYIKRRHGFLGNHPDFKANPKLYDSVIRDADQVFHSQADELSVEHVRNRELICEILTLLPLPTSTNTDTLDNFRSTGTKEWTKETGHPTHFTPSPQSSPSISANEPIIDIEDLISPEQNQNATSGLGEPVSGAHIEASSAGRKMGKQRQTVTAGPDPVSPLQQTSANNGLQHPSNNTIGQQDSQVPYPSAMDPPRAALNAPEDQETMRKIVQDLGKKGLTAADLPQQYQQQQHRPQAQVSAVRGRALDTPVKSPPNAAGTKRAAPVDLDEADADSSVEAPTTTAADKQPKKRGRPAAKKPRLTVTAQEDPEEEPIVPKKQARRLVAKKPRVPPTQAAPKAAAKIKTRPTQEPISVASSVSSARPTMGSKRPTTGGKGSAREGSQRPTLGGKGPPQQSGSATPGPVSRRQSHPSTVTGARVAKTKTEAAEAAVERRQALLSELLSRKRSIRHPDLGPEFFDPANFTQDEKDPEGEPPVRCVCEKNIDDGKYMGDWIGCDNEECRVWQHVPCMGEAVPPPEAMESSKYLCQQCDPWAHRKLISRLRKGQAIP